MIKQNMDFWWILSQQDSHDIQLILHVLVPLLLMMSTYWILGALFMTVDLTGRPKLVTQYKINKKEDSRLLQTITTKEIVRVVRQVLFNQTVVATPVIVICFYIKRLNGYDDGAAVPSLVTFLKDFAVFVLLEEILFYYSHRILHHPLMYRRFHKKHHEWIYPIGISAIYCHPVEHVLSNVLPSVLGPALTGSHAITFWLWMLFTTSYGVVVHSGYHLPFLASPEAHNYHHAKFNEMFGIMGILDRLHGTDKNFRKSKYFKNHRVLLWFTPME